MNILTIGAGAYGLALSTILSDKNDVTVYSSIKEEIEKLRKTYKNEELFPNIELPKKIKFINQIEKKYDLIILALPTNIIKKELQRIKEKINNTPIIITSKGMNDNKFSYEIVKEILDTEDIFILSGPSFAIDTIKKQTILLTVAPKNIPNIFNEEYVKIETTEDIQGIEICGMIKNIYAIAAGILGGLNASESTKAAFLTKIISETKKIIKKYNGNESTVFLSCGIGDILLTCTSKSSRNYRLGYIIGKKVSEEKIIDYINNTTIEGLKSLSDFKKRFESENIINTIYNIIYNKENPETLINNILD